MDMADPTLIEAAKGIAIVIAACGGLASTVIAATSRKKADNGSAAVLKTLNRIDSKVDGLTSRLDRHEAAITERVGALEREVERLRDERHDRANQLQDAIFAAAKLAERKP